MSRQVTIETPFPTLEETAHTLGVSPTEAERLQRILSERRPPKRAKNQRKNQTSIEICRKESLKEGVSGILHS